MSTTVLRPPEGHCANKLSPRLTQAPAQSPSKQKMTCSSQASTSKSSKKFHRRSKTFGASDSEIHLIKHKKRHQNKRMRTTGHPYDVDDKVKVRRKWSEGGKGANHPDDPQSNHLRAIPLPQLRAPDNTTQFLMDDFEQRETDRPCPIQPRLRCYSVCSGIFGTPPVVDVDLSSDSELSCDESQDNEFEQELDTVKLESIEGMSREQVNQSMLEAEKSNLHLISRVNHLRAENNRLKRLLEEHGIEYKLDSESRSDRTSASSLHSDTSTVSNFDDHHHAHNQDEMPHPEGTEEPHMSPMSQVSGPLMHPTPPTNYD